MDDCFSLLEFHFENNRNPVLAEPMAKYMRNKFPFLGIKKPERTRALRTFYSQTGMLKEPFDPTGYENFGIKRSENINM